nr:MAG TPA: hypothetical protein [Caudoviricetes sp.]
MSLYRLGSVLKYASAVVTVQIIAPATAAACCSVTIPNVVSKPEITGAHAYSDLRNAAA